MFIVIGWIHQFIAFILKMLKHFHCHKEGKVLLSDLILNGLIRQEIL